MKKGNVESTRPCRVCGHTLDPIDHTKEAGGIYCARCGKWCKPIKGGFRKVPSLELKE